MGRQHIRVERNYLQQDCLIKQLKHMYVVLKLIGVMLILGVNAVTLMEIKEPPDPRCTKLIPVVEYAVDRRIVTGKPDYWDYATRLELAVLAKDKDAAIKSASNALALLREPWEAETTIRNLRLIREARERRQDTFELDKPD